jgi:hypothetical protein
MKFSETSMWGQFDGRDGILYFAHRCEEMLFHYTCDKYRTPILNTNRIVEEYCSTKELIDDEVISSGHEDIILEEFLDTFANDIILKKFWGKNKIDNFLKAWGSLSREDKFSRMNYLRSTFSNKVYLNWAQIALLECIKFPKEKKQIESITKSLIPELICIGYAPEYIYFNIKRLFFEQKVVSSNCLNEFLNIFDLNRNQYGVYVAASHKVNILKPALERRMNVSFDNDGNFSLLKKDKDKIILHFKDIEALDPYSAMKKTRNQLDLLFQFYGFLSNRKKPFIQKKGMVSEAESKKKIFLETEEKDYDVISNLNDIDAAKMAENSISFLITRAKNNFPILLKAIELHNAALSISDYRNAFLNLWSILEVLVPKKKNKTKIDTIVETIELTLKRGYLYDIIDDLRKKIKDSIPNEYKNLLGGIEFSEDDNEKIAAFIFLSEYDEKRKEFYKALSDYPILRSRISQFNTEFKNLESINKSSERYCQRVRWHLYRLYRTRNLIIHSGDTPSHIKALGEHLHFYVDELITEILANLITGTNLYTIDNVIINLELEQNIFESSMANDTRINKVNLKAILHRDVKYLEEV